MHKFGSFGLHLFVYLKGTQYQIEEGQKMQNNEIVDRSSSLSSVGGQWTTTMDGYDFATSRFIRAAWCPGYYSNTQDLLQFFATRPTKIINEAKQAMSCVNVVQK
jgi:hypothetical protein